MTDSGSSTQVIDRSVSELCQIPPGTLGYYGDSRGHSDTHRCCVTSLIGAALVERGVRQHAREDSISKRAPSTTRTSLRSTRSDRSRQAALESTSCARPKDIISKLCQTSWCAAIT